MAQLDILDIFEDCVNRLAVGQSIDECLQIYPDYASRLRPMLETTETVQSVELIPELEQAEDISAIWEIIQQKRPYVRPVAVLPRRSRHIRSQLLIAIILLLLLTIATAFFLSRPDLPNVTVPIVDTLTLVPTETDTIEAPVMDDEVPTSTVVDVTPSATSINTATPSQTLTASVTLTPSLTPRSSPTFTLTATHTVTVSPTRTLIASSTPLPTATFVPGCGEALTITDATKLVLEIYPNTSIISAQEVTRFNDRLVWEITTSHGIEVTIDVGCGYILTIERNNSGQANMDATNIANSNEDDNLGSDASTNSNSNSSPNFGVNANDNSDDGLENNNDNSNDNGDDNSGMGSDDSGDDNSGMG